MMKIVLPTGILRRLFLIRIIIKVLFNWKLSEDMRIQIKFILSLAVCVMASGLMTISQHLEYLDYNHPDLLVDMGVGLTASPLPIDFNENGLTDLVVVCPDWRAGLDKKPNNGVFFFENSGEYDPETNLPVYKPARRLGKGVKSAAISYIDGKPFVTTTGKWYPDFKNTAFKNPLSFPAPEAEDINPEGGRIRANQWRLVDFNGNGVNDIIIGIDFWGERSYRGREYYGWQDAYDENGQWMNGPVRGYVYLLRNTGSNDKPEYEYPELLYNTDGSVIEVFGLPSPNFADFTGDGKLDLICGEFRDGFTFFKNVGTREKPLYAPGRPLTNGDVRIRMDLPVIIPVAYDFTGNGWPDLIVGQEDGRVAMIEHTGVITDGMPVFGFPRYFRQQADGVKFGALVTPFGFDWNGDGRDDIITGNTAGNIAFIENLGGSPPKWAAPQLLEAGGEIIHILAGSSGSIQGPAEAKWGYTTLSVADWNHNGLPDLIVNSIWGKVVWYENIGTRTEPKLAAAQPVEVSWEGEAPKPAWNWWEPEGEELVTQWRTTPVAVDWTGNGLTDLIMLDHEGYLALFRREQREGESVLLPGERVFRLDGEEGPLRLQEGITGRSGRRKIAICDFDGDGRPDLLVNSLNVSFLRNIGEENGVTVFRDEGLLSEHPLAGHTTQPAVIDLTGDGIPELLIGAEDGFFYYLENPFID
jgi:hypothetical protein